MTFALRLARDTLVLPVIPVAIGVAAATATRSATMRRVAATLAMAAGIVVAHFVDVGVPRMPPIDTIGWIPVVAAIASLSLVVDGRPVARSVFVFVITAIAVWLIGRPVWTTMGGGPWILLAATIATAIVGSLEAATGRVPPAVTLVAFAMTTASASIVCLLGHSALLAQVLGASAAVVGASGLAAIRSEPAKTSMSLAVLAAITVVTYARLYATLSTLGLVLLVASAAAPLIASLLPMGRRSRSIACVVLAIALGSGAILAAR